MGERPGNLPARPQDRPNWGNWSENRGDNWQQRVDNRHDTWNNWQQNNQQRMDSFQNNRDQRWSELENARNDRQDWRNQNRDDWQEHRKDMWDYRWDRADEVWDNARDFYDDCFDDHWWGRCGWLGHGVYHGFGHYPVNPWWWWRPCAWGGVSSWVYGATVPPPVYPDYGTTVVYEGDTVYLDNQPLPVAEYTQPVIEKVAVQEQAPPPAPAPEGQPEEWMTLGVFSLVQEEKGDPILFMQLSINREGVISGAYQNVLTEDQRPITGQLDKKTQTVAWRIGENRNTICTTSLANLTEDVCTVALHFHGNRTETWILVRMKEPAETGQPAAVPQIQRTLPPLNPVMPPK